MASYALEICLHSLADDAFCFPTQAVARRSGKAIGADKALGYKHALKEKKVLEELDKFRRDIKEGKEIRHEKHERAQHGSDWENIKQGIQEQFDEKIMKPLEKISGHILRLPTHQMHQILLSPLQFSVRVLFQLCMHECVYTHM
jgi:hypothetical protein